MTSRLKPQDGFQSTLSVRRATSVTSNATTLPKFQSTLSVRRATRWLGHGRPSDDISIHALREESDRRRHARGLPGHIISIHALREESDEIDFGHPCPPLISIHALREESDAQQTVLRRRFHGFQSTLSVRRATRYYLRPDLSVLFQSTLSVRATGNAVDAVKAFEFQSTLSVWRATTVNGRLAKTPTFQSTLSVRRATGQDRRPLVRRPISIHALREESDLS